MSSEQVVEHNENLLCVSFLAESKPKKGRSNVNVRELLFLVA